VPSSDAVSRVVGAHGTRLVPSFALTPKGGRQ